MNIPLMSLEVAVVVLGLGLLVADLWTPGEKKRWLGYVGAIVIGLVFLASYSSLIDAGSAMTAFKGMYVQDGLALFFKR
jgi:hypothetical protein